MNRARILLLCLFWSASGLAGPGAMSLRAPDLRAAVEAYVAALPVPEGGEYAVECRDIPDSIVIPRGVLLLSVDASATPVLRGRVPIAVEVIVDGVTVRRVMVTALVRTYAAALITSRPLGFHAAVGGDDVRIARVETTQLTRRPLGTLASLAGKRTRRIVTEGTVLSGEMFEVPPLVAHGDHVTLRAASKGVSISTGAVALEDGRLGSVIGVKASHTRERLRARVIDAGVVEALEE